MFLCTPYSRAGDEGMVPLTNLNSALTSGEFIFTHCPLWGSSRCLLNRKFGGPLNWFGHFGENTNPFPFPRIEIRFVVSPARDLVTVLTELSRLTRVDSVSI